jgi:hypothetical protein
LRNMIVVNAAVTAARGDVTLRLCEINAGDHRIYDGGVISTTPACRARQPPCQAFPLITTCFCMVWNPM